MEKNISLSEEAYQKLNLEKRADESFSDVILRLLTYKKPLREVIGKKLLDPTISLEEIRTSGKKTMGRLTNETS